jgi:hypothetical protein
MNAAPSLGIVALCIPAGLRVNWDFGQLAVPSLLLPAYPLRPIFEFARDILDIDISHFTNCLFAVRIRNEVGRFYQAGFSARMRLMLRSWSALAFPFLVRSAHRFCAGFQPLHKVGGHVDRKPAILEKFGPLALVRQIR